VQRASSHFFTAQMVWGGDGARPATTAAWASLCRQGNERAHLVWLPVTAEACFILSSHGGQSAHSRLLLQHCVWPLCFCVRDACRPRCPFARPRRSPWQAVIYLWDDPCESFSSFNFGTICTCSLSSLTKGLACSIASGAQKMFAAQSVMRTLQHPTECICIFSHCLQVKDTISHSHNAAHAVASLIRRGWLWDQAEKTRLTMPQRQTEVCVTMWTLLHVCVRVFPWSDGTHTYMYK
jgi:hypothetical protein